MTDEAAAFRRRIRTGGVGVLVDEVVALLQVQPGALIARSLLPVLPVAVLGLGFVHAHRTRWAGQEWAEGPLQGSIAFGVVLALAYLLRGVGHGLVARHVVRCLHPAAVLAERVPFGGLAAASAIGGAGVTLGALVGGIPGLVVAGWFLPVPAAMAVEGVPLWSALFGARPRGAVLKSTRAVLGGAVVLSLVWLNLVLGAGAAVGLLRAMTGADTGALEMAVAPSNPSFLVAAIVLALVLIEPVWAVLRAVIYLDDRLGRSGADLEDRWRVLSAERGRSAAAAGLGAVLLCFAAPLQAEPVGAELAPYAERVQGLQREVEASIEAYDASGWEDLDHLHEVAGDRASGVVVLPGGASLRVDGRALIEDLPSRIHGDATRRRAARVARLLEQAAAGPDAVGEPSEAPEEARALLDRVLAEGGYETEAATPRSARAGAGIRERLHSWWESLTAAGPPPPPSAPSAAPRFDARWIPALAAAVGVGVLLLILARRIGGAPPASREEPTGGAVDLLPDARARTPDGWRDHAVALGEEGRLREAVRAHYLGALAALDRRRAIDYRPDRTNGTLLAGFRGSPDERRGFAEATRRFESAWYGEAEVAAADLAGMRAACGRLRDPDRAHE